MTPARLRALVAVASAGSVRAAATQLFITESAVSAAVTALSQDLGLPLLGRDGRGVKLTAAGTVYADYAGRVLGLLDEARAAAQGAEDPRRGRLRLAAVTSAGDQLLPALLARFQLQWPEVEITLEVGPSARVWSMLDEHRVDVVIAGSPPAASGVVVLATRPNELIAVASPDRATTFAMETTPWLLREEGSGTRSTVETYLREQRAGPPRLVLGSNGAVLTGAVAGLGLALVSRDAVRFELTTGRLAVIRLPGLPLRRPWHAVSGPAPVAVTQLFVRTLLASPDQPRWRKGPASQLLTGRAQSR
jgi:LysR family transcriptional regulator, low CO2-responsive transcriptional regulator